MRIVWTAHNVLPHEQVFHDDAAARRALVRASDLVLAHSRATLKALDGIGARPRRVVIVPHGRYEIAGDREQLRMPGSGKSPRRLLFLGLMRAYKGVEELISAVAGLDPDVCVQVDIVGECPDDELRLRLERLARDAGERVRLRFGWVSDAEVTPLIATSDAAVMPFRAATTSGSALLMMSHGRPIIVPPLPAFDDMAAEALIRYDGSTSDLRRAIRDVVRAKPGALAEAGDAASSYASSLTWDNAAERTLVAFTALEGP
jgi:glycosyltransferase involved in cell wall biosynthesis